MQTRLARLFSIRPGQENKVLLLGSLHLVFYLGLMWGDKAQYTLFLNAWSASDLSLIFIGNAIFAFIMGLAYTSWADRISNERLLLVLIGLMMLWLISVQILLLTAGGPFSLVYPYFSLVYQAFRDLSTLHILNYLNDFYDTRAAKTALPLLLAAATTGSMLAGFSSPLLGRTIGLQFVPVAWLACLLLATGLIFLIRRRLAPELSQIQQLQQAHRDRPAKDNALANLLARLNFVRGSRLLRWLALATFAMVLLMNVLIFQTGRFFQSYFQGDPDGLFRFLGIVDGFTDAIGLTIQAFILSRLVAHFGVGKMGLFFPSTTFISVGLLGFLPHLSTAIAGRLNHTALKQAFRNPLDAMLYNSLPLNVKNRAKGFINGLIVPCGALGAGLLVLGGRSGILPVDFLVWVAIVFAVIYLLSAFRIRKEYSHSMAGLLAGDELAIFALDHNNLDQPDPAILQRLYRQLNESRDEHHLIILAEILYTLEGSATFPRLLTLAQQQGPTIQAAIMGIVAADWLTEPAIRSLCFAGLKAENVAVRRAAVTALSHDPAAAQDEPLLDAFLELINDPDETIQANIIPSLIASGDFYYLTPAVQTLAEWLADKTNDRRRALGLRVLAKTGAERLVRTLVRYLDDPAPLVRRQAVELIDDLTAQTPLAELKQFGLKTLHSLLADADESVRLAAVNGLGRFKTVEAGHALLTAMNDGRFEIRRQACTMMEPILKQELEKLLAANDYRSECAAYILARANQAPAKRRALELIEKLTTAAYTLHIQQFALPDVGTPAVQLLKTAFQEQTNLCLERIFWLLSALNNPEQVQAIRRSLCSKISVDRINATEALESMSSPQLARLIAPLHYLALPVLVQIGQENLSLSTPTNWEVYCQLWPALDGEIAISPVNDDLMKSYGREWLEATTIHVLLETVETTMSQEQPASNHIKAALQITLNSNASPLLQITTRRALAHLEQSDGQNNLEEPMLTPIEEVIFLKEVPFFQGMTINQLRVLADISEEVSYGAGQQIFAEGESGDALFVIVSGQVAIQRRGKGERITRLATLGPREYFAEMSIFDNEPYSADAVALKPSQLLLIRQEPLVALIKHQPDLALDLLKVFSQRLRQANAIISEKTETKPKPLLDLYDKFSEL